MTGGADGAPAILVLEFNGLGPGNSFDAVLRALPGQPRVLRDPIDAHIDASMGLNEQARVLCAELPGPPLAVFAHCTAGVLAMQVAALTEVTTGTHPQVVLFDPEVPTGQTFTDEFVSLHRSLTGEPGAQVRTPAEAEAGLDRAQTVLADHYGGTADAKEVAGELIARHRGWLRFLFAAAQAPPVATTRPVSVVTSGPTPQLAPLLPPGQAVELHHCGTSGAALLDSADAHRITVGIVTSLLSDGTRVQ